MRSTTAPRRMLTSSPTLLFSRVHGTSAVQYSMGMFLSPGILCSTDTTSRFRTVL